MPTLYKRYGVEESTPGYLPEEDEIPVFDQYAEAFNFLKERYDEIQEADWAYDEDGNFCLDVSPLEEWGFTYSDMRRIHDLGRIVQIVMVE